jgi:hypothetical protein
MTYREPPVSTDVPTAQPYYVRDQQDWAVEQERMRHSQAIYQVGEYAVFVLLWHIADHEAGLVARCSRCYGSSDPIEQKIAETYNQPIEHRCPECFGTTFEGGFKARIVRPAIFSDSDEGETKQARGIAKPEDLSVESTPDFRVRSGDYVFRGNGNRFQLRVPQRVTLRTGFGMPLQSADAIGYNHARASLEDPTSVAYLIPPNRATVDAVLATASKVPVDFSTFEIIRAPLIPVGDD